MVLNHGLYYYFLNHHYEKNASHVDTLLYELKLVHRPGHLNLTKGLFF